MSNANFDATAINTFMYGLLTSDTEDTAIGATLADMHDTVVRSITEQCSRIFAMETSVEDMSCDLARAALDAYYAAPFGTVKESGSCDHVLNTYYLTIRNLANKVKSVKKRTSVLTNFTRIVRHGTGALVKTDHVNKQGDALFELDDSMACVTLDRGQYVTRSNNQRKAVRAKYLGTLRSEDLLRPRMYRDFAAREKMNWLQFTLTGADKVRKWLDDEALERFNRMMDNQMAIDATNARRAEQAAAI